MKEPTYAIKEIFESVQGEGFWSGTPALFVRFAGCNLSCAFCDTDFSGGTPMVAEQVVEEIKKVLGIQPVVIDGVASTPRHSVFTIPRHIVLTGGEPSLQSDLHLLTAIRSLYGGYGIKPRIAIETNGTRILASRFYDWITVSPKDQAVHSEQKDNEPVRSIVMVESCNELKFAVEANFVVPDHHRWPCTSEHVYLSPVTDPVTGEIPKENIERCLAILKLNPAWRISLQTHKILGVR